MKKMKSIIALFLVFSLLLVVEISYGRKDLGEYWKNMMNEQPMPEAIKNLIQAQHVLDDDDAAGDAGFIRDFDVHPNIILYHTHVDHMKHHHMKQKQKVFHDQNVEPSNRKSLLTKGEPSRNND